MYSIEVLKNARYKYRLDLFDTSHNHLKSVYFHDNVSLYAYIKENNLVRFEKTKYMKIMDKAIALMEAMQPDD